MRELRQTPAHHSGRDAMLISCLTVTQPGRTAEVAQCARCFERQTYPDRELVVVHDGEVDYHEAVEEILVRACAGRFRLVRAEPGTSLGALRNIAVRTARGELICQWDDDDLYHPERLARQYRHLADNDGEFCFLTDQLHWFQNTGEFFWDDWNVERYPMNLIQGTLLGRRDRMPAYPAIDRGEDTPVLQTLHRQGAKLVPMSGFGSLYIYVFNGANAWGLVHHAAISQWKRLGAEELDRRRTQLQRHLQAFGLPIRSARFPHDAGELIIELNAGT